MHDATVKFKLSHTVSKTSTLKQTTTLTHQTRSPHFDKWDKTQLARERRRKKEWCG